MALVQFASQILQRCQALPIGGNGVRTAIWNNQVQWMQDGSIEAIQLPAVFVEIVFNGGNHDAEWMTGRECTVRLHLVMEQLNKEGYFEQNTLVFAYRDVLVQFFSKWHVDTTGYPYNFTPFQLVGEQPQYDHTNLYEYVVEFATMFSETMGTAQSINEIQTTLTEVTINATKE